MFGKLLLGEMEMDNIHNPNKNTAFGFIFVYFLSFLSVCVYFLFVVTVVRHMQFLLFLFFTSNIIS